MKYPFNVRSFFTDAETKDLGLGLQLWRGYFQSVRPASGRMLINVDISTGTMYKAGPLLTLCLEFLDKRDPNSLAPNRNFPDRERLRLQRFISGIRVLTKHVGADGSVTQTPRVVKKLTSAGANTLTFNMGEGGSMTVADYFYKSQNQQLRFPDVICVEVGSGALIPLELCTVPPGQIMRKQVPPEKTKDVLDFATKRPADRLKSIVNGLNVLAYGQSEYVRQFGMRVDTSGPLKVHARVLKPPTLKYGPGSKQPTIVPRDGSWNMVDKRFYRPAEVKGWCIVVYEKRSRFGEDVVDNLINGLTASFRQVGIKLTSTQRPPVIFPNGQGVIQEQLKSAGMEVVKLTKLGPNLIVVVLPEGGNDIYTAVKHFGDVTPSHFAKHIDIGYEIQMGVATQCLKSSKCYRAKPQYWANVSMKINVKLGGINTVPDPSSVKALTDPAFPTIVIGADVVHPAPGSDDRPSFTALYVLQKYISYRQNVEKKPAPQPKRIILYRDGVSEGQFKQVLDQELPALQEACKTLNISAKITVIIVGKRHHNEREGDRSGNCLAGTVVDSDISHPTEFDFYLQSHGGLLGTSRPAHYSLDHHLRADPHDRAKNHYDPEANINLSESGTQLDGSDAEKSLENFRVGFKPVHRNQEFLMYFSVRRT
ncbi:hypothetical protein H0H93_012916 [Arthromyces matolae]|nr:hypothetical protein H0H93_012916 [Arthromyces matolae]